MRTRLILWCERTYLVIHKIKKIAPEWIISFIVASISTLPFEEATNIRTLVDRLFDFHLPIIFLMWLSIIASIIISLLDHMMIHILHKHNDYSELKKIMEDTIDPTCFNIENYKDGFIWGQDRTLWVCDNLIEGYKTYQVVIEKAHLDQYFRFPKPLKPQERDLNQAYQDWIEHSEKMQNTIRKGNNGDKLMVTGFERNFNKRDRKLYISVAKTQWSMNQFVWTEIFKEGFKDKIKELEAISDNTTKNYLPNSFCLHLVVISADRKVLINQISGNKDNDYPHTIAATIGEQLDTSDFNGKTDYNANFLDFWIKRAFYEEFGITDSIYKRIVDPDSARVLAIVEEGDIYNVSMVVTIMLNYNYDDFAQFMSTAIVVDKEFSDPHPLDLESIPTKLYTHFKKCKKAKTDRDLKFTNGEYHPSTAMRLFLTYSHFYGVCRFKNEYLKAMDNDPDPCQ